MSANASVTDAASYGFFRDLARVINSGQSRSVILSGNVHDLFHVPARPGAHRDRDDEAYLPLISYLADRCSIPGIIVAVYELNGPIRFLRPEDQDTLKNAWVAWQCGVSHDDLVLQGIADRKRQQERELVAAEFDRRMREAIGRPTLALEFLRQLSHCSRASTPEGRAHLHEKLLIIVEAADMLLPTGGGDITRLSASDRHRVTVVQDWFSDPGFMNGDDSVILIAESRALVHPRITTLPSVLSVEVPAPDIDERRRYIEWRMDQYDDDEASLDGNVRRRPEIDGGIDGLAAQTAGLSIHALRQILLAGAHSGEPITPALVIEKVQEYIGAQLGDDVVEFKKPAHTLDDVVGNTRLKAFIHEELLPRFRATGAAALPGAAVAGPIGGGKTFIFEAAATSLGMPVLVLKNIRSQWFGQTDVIFERLRRVLEALGKVVIFVDEADTQFGQIGPSAHATERRLTGKIQQMMSDPRLRGEVIWLLMTARIHLLSPDIRRPGRVGDLIIPVLDPEGEDRDAFIRWTVRKSLDGELDDATLGRLREVTTGYSAAAFAALRSALRARAALVGRALTLDETKALIADMIPPAIGRTRRYQTLQALINCTRRSLLPDPNVTEETREAWQREIRALELEGIS